MKFIHPMVLWLLILPATGGLFAPPTTSPRSSSPVAQAQPDVPSITTPAHAPLADLPVGDLPERAIEEEESDESEGLDRIEGNLVELRHPANPAARADRGPRNLSHPATRLFVLRC